MNNEKYNGWSNYATWRVQLEIFNGTRLEDLGMEKKADKHDIAERCKNEAELLLDDEAGQELAKDYAMAFIDDVNWHEIAEALQDNE